MYIVRLYYCLWNYIYAAIFLYHFHNKDDNKYYFYYYYSHYYLKELYNFFIKSILSLFWPVNIKPIIGRLHLLKIQHLKRFTD